MKHSTFGLHKLGPKMYKFLPSSYREGQGLRGIKSLGLSDFKRSHGWNDRFKARHQIKCKVVSGESASAAWYSLQAKNLGCPFHVPHHGEM